MTDEKKLVLREGMSPDHIRPPDPSMSGYIVLTTGVEDLGSKKPSVGFKKILFVHPAGNEYSTLLIQSWGRLRWRGRGAEPHLSHTIVITSYELAHLTGTWLLTTKHQFSFYFRL